MRARAALLALLAGPAAAGGLAPPLLPPDAVVVAYRCANGATVTAIPRPGDRMQLALSGRMVTLSRAPAASGTRYVGGGLQWWSKGLEDANLAVLAPGEDVASAPGTACRAV